MSRDPRFGNGQSRVNSIWLNFGRNRERPRPTRPVTGPLNPPKAEVKPQEKVVDPTPTKAPKQEKTSEL